ncbi:MAG: F0F1 ATP synthase subunit delta [Acidobacteria bacterium]|nr:F0F1 ATP synthase subunit delta [Acidobacteriota bacterium]
MSTRTSATRYARALFDIARQESDIAKVDQDLAAVVSAIAENAELAQVLASRAVPEAARRNIIVAVAAKLGAAAPVTKLVGLLAERRRLELLPEIAEVYQERLLAHQNIVQADVTTAAPLSPDATKVLEASLSAATGKKVSMRVSVDSSLLGGVVARVGSTVYDGSVKTQLQKMRDQLVAQG